MEENIIKEWEEWRKKNLRKCTEDAAGKIKEEAKGEIENFLKEERLFFNAYDSWNYYSLSEGIEINAENFEEYIKTFKGALKNLTLAPLEDVYFITEKTLNKLWEIKEIQDFSQQLEELGIYLSDELCDYVCDIECEFYDTISGYLLDYFTDDKIIQLFSENPNYAGLIEESKKIKKEKEKLKASILKVIPEEISELYPLARSIKRHFIIHVGETNSGKTHEALTALSKAERGVYLAPLRLMAHEAYETLNDMGTICEMETGEEVLEKEGAKVKSETIELLDIEKHYDIAVIDECQMISDISRGGAWTQALLGVAADTVYLCMSSEAIVIITILISMCGDTYEIIEHKRKTPLEFDSENFVFPASVQKGDALIVFSRKKAIECSGDLQEKGYKCSVIYGALPYESRHEEARKFAEGETDILVATDAIGMGMNIPIRRVVFLGTQKFDGRCVRKLYGTEIKQIAGRAGRYGIYDTGYYTSAKSGIKKLYDNKEKQVEKAVLGFPKQLLKVEGKLSEIAQRWLEIVPLGLFEKQDLSNLVFLSECCEKLTDDKELIYKLATIPVNTEDFGQFALYTELSKCITQGHNISVENYIRLSDYLQTLEELEELYKEYDLLHNFVKRFSHEKNDLKLICDEKRKISDKITEILRAQNLEGKKCACCEKRLPWNYPHRICDHCYKRRSYF